MSLLRTLCIALTLSLGASASHAATPTESLAACLQSKTTPEDRKTMVIWVFNVMGAHPALKSQVLNTPAEIDKANRAQADLVTRLLTESCASEAKALLKSGADPQQAMQQAFQPLGMIAMRDLMTNPEVFGALMGYIKFLDRQKIESLMK